MTRFGRLAIVLCAGLFVFMTAGLIALAGPGKLSFLIIGGIASLFIFAFRTDRLILLTGVMVFLVIGQLLYFAKVNQALWIAYGLGILLFFRIPFHYPKSPLQNKSIALPLAFPLSFFILITGMSILLNTPPLLQVIVGCKNLLALWSVFLLIALFAIPFARLEKAFRFLIFLALVQLPFVLYQYFFVAASRSNRGGRMGVSWDAIVGSFGGDPNSGGASGTMAYMLVLAVLLVISLRRYSLTRNTTLIAVAFAAALCIVLAEVKVVVILLPVGVAVLFWKEFFRNSIKAAVGLTMALVMSLGILLAYDHIHYSSTGHQSRDLADIYDNTFGYSVSTQFINFETGEMGRNAAIYFWWKEGFTPDPLRGLFGYGPGASRSASSLAVGEVARKYRFGIDRSAATQMLWDIGLFGCLAYIWILLGGAFMAIRNAKASTSDSAKATLETCAAGLVMAVVMLPYGRDVLELPALTFALMCMLGYAAQAQTLRTIGEGPFLRGAKVYG